MKMDHVVWTDLKSNFEQKSYEAKRFSIDATIADIQSLDAEGKARAAEYVWRTCVRENAVEGCVGGTTLVCQADGPDCSGR
jgi:hypothetical protein